MASSGNFNTWNPLTTKGFINFALGNTSATMNTNYVAVDGTLAARTGKYYWEMNYAADGNFSDGRLFTGIHAISNTVSSGAPYNASDGTNQFYPDPNIGLFVVSHRNASGRGNANIGGSGTTLGSSFINVGLKVSSANTIIMCAMDLDNYIIYWGINGNWKGLANSSDTSSSTDITAVTGVSIPSAFRGFHFSPAAFFSGATSGTTVIINAGQDSTFSGTITSGSANASDSNSVGNFYYTPPTNFLALSSFALPISDDIDPAQTDDDNPSKLFNIVTYTGNGGTQSITGLGFKPDLAVIKAIPTDASSTSWNWFDSSRGVHKSLESDNSNAEENNSNKLTAFGTDGFSVGSDADVNANSVAYCCWGWRLNGGTTASNTSGDINSTTQASDKTGLSVVLYTGNGSQGQSIGHGLTKAPEMVWFKNRSNSSVSGLAMEWIVALSTSTGSPFASRSGSAQTLELNTADAIGAFYRTEGNFTPTTSTFSVPNNGNAPYWFNANGDNYYALCWHSVEGFSKFGFYEGNGNADGPFVYTGFRPRLLVVKNIDASGGWIVVDTKRETFNPVGELIAEWNDSYGQFDPANVNMDILSNGFKLRNTDQKINSSHTFMYMAWGDVPFKYNNTF